MEFAQGTGSFPIELDMSIKRTILAGLELARVTPSMLGHWWIARGIGVPGGGGIFFEIKWPEGIKTYQVRMDATAQDVADAIKG